METRGGSTTSILCPEIGPSLPEVGLRYFDLRKQYFHGTSEKRRTRRQLVRKWLTSLLHVFGSSFPRIDRLCALDRRFDIAADARIPGLKILPFFLINRLTRENGREREREGNHDGGIDEEWNNVGKVWRTWRDAISPRGESHRRTVQLNHPTFAVFRATRQFARFSLDIILL